MISPESRLFCQLDGLPASSREQQRLEALSAMGLLEAESVPIFEEATQIAAHFLDAPICFLAMMSQDYEILKSAVGLSQLGLMNEIAASRQIIRHDSFGTHVVDSHQSLAISDTTLHPAFANNRLVHQYSIRAYLGVPLLTSTGYCLGTLTVMDLMPRSFTRKEIEFLELAARWSISEFEYQHFSKTQPMLRPDDNLSERLPVPTSANQVQIELLNQLTQELRTPLTSVMGMASVLIREIYGPLTNKQKEYLDIIHHSGQYLLSLVNEILELAEPSQMSRPLNSSSVDIEMLCQQAINTLEQAATRREQQIRLTVEPGKRIWQLDKDKVRQILYHLIFSVIQSSSTGSIVRVHVSRKNDSLNLAVWASHPWLGDGSTEEVYSAYGEPKTEVIEAELVPYHYFDDLDGRSSEFQPDLSDISAISADSDVAPMEKVTSEELYQNLGVLLGRQLAELHGGQLQIQSSLGSSYRYVLSLPQLPEPTNNL